MFRACRALGAEVENGAGVAAAVQRGVARHGAPEDGQRAARVRDPAGRVAAAGRDRAVLDEERAGAPDVAAEEAVARIGLALVAVRWLRVTSAPAWMSNTRSPPPALSGTSWRMPVVPSSSPRTVTSDEISIAPPRARCSPTSSPARSTMSSPSSAFASSIGRPQRADRRVGAARHAAYPVARVEVVAVPAVLDDEVRRRRGRAEDQHEQDRRQSGEPRGGRHVNETGNPARFFRLLRVRLASALRGRGSSCPAFTTMFFFFWKSRTTTDPRRDPGERAVAAVDHFPAGAAHRCRAVPAAGAEAPAGVGAQAADRRAGLARRWRACRARRRSP